MKQFLSILTLVLGVVLASCSTQSKNENTTSSIARLTAFSLGANTQYPGLAEAKFTIKELVDTGLVYNIDSMRYGTSLDSVVPRYNFYTTPYSSYLHLIRHSDIEELTIDTMLPVSQSDTLNLNCDSIFLTIYSSDRTTVKTYRILPLVHTMDPDLFVWDTINPAIYSAGDDEQQLLIVDNIFYLFVNNGFATRLYTSNDEGETWVEQTVSGLPADCHVRSIVSSASRGMFYAQNTTLYHSTDGKTWSTTDYASDVAKLHMVLMDWIDSTWVVAEDAQEQLQLMTVSDEGLIAQMTLSNDFPVSGYSVVTFTATSDRERAMIFGGMSADGEYLNNRWNLEYSKPHKTLRITDYAIEQPDFTHLTGAAIVSYNNQLCLFGGMDEKGEFPYREMYYSTDEGMHWQMADTTKCQVPLRSNPRQRICVVTHKEYIYILGGQDRTTTYADLYRGWLQSIGWNKK